MFIRNNVETNQKIRKAQNNYIEKVLKNSKLGAKHVEVRSIVLNDVYMIVDGQDYKLTHDTVSRAEISYDEYGNAKLPLGYLLYKIQGSNGSATELVKEGVEVMIWKK